MSENLPRLERLRSVRQWLAWQLSRTDEQIRQEEQRAAEQARAERLQPPRDPGWCVSYGIGADRRPIEVHIGDCGMAKHRKVVSQEDARRAIGEGVEPCQFCRPDTALGLL